MRKVGRVFVSNVVRVLPVLAALGACGAVEDESLAYRAVLLPVNGSLSDAPAGTATFVVNPEADLFSVSVSATGLDSVVHPMHIHAVAACPGPLADGNQDGFIDVREGMVTFGRILMPLDSDLTTQGANDFPQGARVTYDQTTSLTRFLQALQVDDPDPDDAVTTLGDAGVLNLAGRTVVVHGVSDALPATVDTIAGGSPSATLPVLCGVIELVN